MNKEHTDEPKPPGCVCCEYMNKCTSDPQKPSYCPDANYSKYLLSLTTVKEEHND